MKIIHIIPLIIAALFLAACTPQEQLAGDTQSSAVIYPFYAASGATFASFSQQDNVFISNSNSTGLNITITIYGYNSSGSNFKEAFNLNGSGSATSANLYSALTRVILNQSLVGNGFTVVENRSRGLTIATITGTENYIAARADNGFASVVPDICLNSSAMGVKQFNEFNMFVKSNGNETITPQISADSSIWFPLSAISSKANQTEVSLNDKSIMFVRFQQCSNDGNSSNATIALAAK